MEILAVSKHVGRPFSGIRTSSRSYPTFFPRNFHTIASYISLSVFEKYGIWYMVENTADEKIKFRSPKRIRPDANHSQTTNRVIYRRFVRMSWPRNSDVDLDQHRPHSSAFCFRTEQNTLVVIPFAIFFFDIYDDNVNDVNRHIEERNPKQCCSQERNWDFFFLDRGSKHKICHYLLVVFYTHTHILLKFVTYIKLFFGTLKTW